MAGTITPFTIAIAQERLDDLSDRLARTRWPADYANSDWSYGANCDYLRELVDYWRTAYDWRRHEREMNRFRHYRTVIDGVPIHYIHERGKGPNPLPLILSHGWPWTFWDMYKIIGPLNDPQAHGGDARDAFDVFVPSLPGFVFSTPLTKPGVNAFTTADLWQVLMNDVLGYPKFGAHGGDWGAAITAQLGHKYADRLIGIHILNGAPLDFFNVGLPQAADYAPDEAGWYEKTTDFFANKAVHVAIQGTEPQTISYGLNDSPVGLCAWLVEKRRNWSDCEGDVERRYTRDELLTSVMLYWLTESFVTSARYYAEARRHPWQPSHHGQLVVNTPTGIALFEKDLCHWPRRTMERCYDLRRYRRFPKGGHFCPMEEPQTVVDELRAFFRALR
jgi:pimeloyl-ACP methyl ester carboxylesterase